MTAAAAGRDRVVLFARHVQTWADYLAAHPVPTPPVPRSRPFSHSANSFVGAWHGDITALGVHSIAFGSNAGLVPRRGASRVLFNAAGSDTVKDCRQKRPCPLGHVAVTTAGHLPCKNLVHMALPDTYDRDTVVSAYGNALTCMPKHRIEEMAFASLSSTMFGADDDELAEVRVQAIRDWVDKNLYGKRQSVDRVILAAKDPQEYDRLIRLLFAYFPPQDTSQL
ncbi:Macro domain-containing protein [Plasmodiophora brassicae]